MRSLEWKGYLPLSSSLHSLSAPTYDHPIAISSVDSDGEDLSHEDHDLDDELKPFNAS